MTAPSNARDRPDEPSAGSGPWVNIAAVAWALDDAPVPTELLLTLIVFARHAKTTDGRESRPSAPTVARETGKSLRQTKYDIERLRELGLLLLGDQSVVAKLPKGQRPIVYDLPLHMTGEKPVTKARGGRSTDNANVTSAVGSTGAADSTGAVDDTTAVQPTALVLVLPTALPPVLPTAPKEDLEKDLEKDKEQSSSSGRSKSLAYLCDRLKIDDDDGIYLLEKIKKDNQPRSIYAYVCGIADDDDFRQMLIDRPKLTDYSGWHASDDGLESRDVPQCGDCDINRFVNNEVDGRTTASYCPRCHPKRKRGPREAPDPDAWMNWGRSKGTIYDGRRVATEDELREGWKPEGSHALDAAMARAVDREARTQPKTNGYQAYQNPTDPDAYNKGWDIEVLSDEDHAKFRSGSL